MCARVRTRGLVRSAHVEEELLPAPGAPPGPTAAPEATEVLPEHVLLLRLRLALRLLLRCVCVCVFTCVCLCVCACACVC